jgi:uncharacterized protein YjeT (DUF2065 family)
MELLVREMMAVIFLVIGLSHAAHPLLWRQVFVDLGRVPYAPFLIAIVTLPIGLVTVLCHNVWTLQPAVMITVFGWGMTTKSIVYSLFPAAYKRVAASAIDEVSPGKVRAFRVGTLVIAALSAWVLVDCWFA